MKDLIDLAAVCCDVLELRDGYNECSFICMLDAGHSGPHCDELEDEGRRVVILWHKHKYTVSAADSERLPLAR